VEVVQANEEVCVAMAKSQVDILGGKMECLSGKDLTGYNYISVGKDGFVPRCDSVGSRSLINDAG
jgi:hypothetical protein